MGSLFLQGVAEALGPARPMLREFFEMQQAKARCINSPHNENSNQFLLISPSG